MPTYQYEIWDTSAVVKNGTDDAGSDDRFVLEFVDPALVDDRDDLDDVGTVQRTENHEEKELGDLNDEEDDNEGETVKDADSHGAQGERSHPEVGEKRDQGRDVRVDLTINANVLVNISIAVCFNSTLSTLKESYA